MASTGGTETTFTYRDDIGDINFHGQDERERGKKDIFTKNKKNKKERKIY